MLPLLNTKVENDFIADAEYEIATLNREAKRLFDEMEVLDANSEEYSERFKRFATVSKNIRGLSKQVEEKRQIGKDRMIEFLGKK